MKLQTRSNAPLSLVETIERYVRSRTGGMIRGLRVEVVGNEIVLSGRTSTYYNKQLATHAVMTAIDEVSLTNDIEVF